MLGRFKIGFYNLLLKVSETGVNSSFIRKIVFYIYIDRQTDRQTDGKMDGWMDSPRRSLHEPGLAGSDSGFM